MLTHTMKYSFAFLTLMVTLGWGQAVRINQTLTIDPQSYRAVSLNVGEGDIGSIVEGYFEVTEYDVNFFIFNEVNYYKWQAGEEAVPIKNFDRSSFGSFAFKVIEPGVKYFVIDNMYTVLANKQVYLKVAITPTTKTEQSPGGCFIATAAFGTSAAREVTILRKFRDTYLMSTALGRFVVRLYYQLSPPIASVIGHSSLLRSFTRFCLQPVIILVQLFQHRSSPDTVTKTEPAS